MKNGSTYELGLVFLRRGTAVREARRVRAPYLPARASLNARFVPEKWGCPTKALAGTLRNAFCRTASGSSGES